MINGVTFKVNVDDYILNIHNSTSFDRLYIVPYLLKGDELMS